MNPSPQNGEQSPCSKGGGFRLLDVILFLLSLAIVAGIAFHAPRARSAPSGNWTTFWWSSPFGATSIAETPTMSRVITAGTWLTTEDGRPVCRTTTYIMRGMESPSPAFCKDWQPPFQPMVYGQLWPTGDGWVRTTPHLQFHTEQGWLP